MFEPKNFNEINYSSNQISKGKAVLVILVLFLLIAIVAAIIFFVVYNNSQNFSSNSDEQSVILVDSDGDNLLDYGERKYGTDINKVDTDGYGFSDYTEVKNGYNPTGKGKLSKKTKRTNRKRN